MFFTFVNILCLIGGFAVLGYIIYCFVTKNKKTKNNHKCITKIEGNKDSDIVELALNLVELLSPYLKHFSGSMTCLHDIVDGSSDLSISTIVFDNIEQTILARNNIELENIYSEIVKDRNTWDIVLYKKKAKMMMDIFKECGIQSHDERKFVWNNESSKKYNRLSQIQLGQECMVVAPYWTFKNGEIFEKGLVK